MFHKSLLLCYLLLAGFSLSAQSGWVREKGKAFVKSDLFFFRASTYYNPEGTAIETSPFSQYTLHVYGEYGLGKGFAIQGYLPLLRWNQFSTTNPAIGQGDLRLELKYALLKGKTPVSISISPEFPTGRANAFANSKILVGDGIFLPTGDGEFNVWTTLAASRSFGKWYASAFGAYNYRTTYQGLAFRDLYQAGLELGFHASDPLWFQLKGRIQERVGESIHPELGFVRGDATTFTGLNLGAWYELNDTWGLAAEVGGNIPGLVPFRNIYVAPFYSIGATWQIK